MNTGHASRFDAVCEDGIVPARYNGLGYQLLRRNLGGSSPAFIEDEFPDFEPKSSTLLLIEVGLIEFHKRGGARVDLPLKERTTRMAREFAPRQPRFEP